MYQEMTFMLVKLRLVINKQQETEQEQTTVETEHGSDGFIGDVC